ncbi:hypothetical protein VCR31J2_1270751 [Vibrio coralliirubri]|uniref:Uncharacterized protein n=1 Tax=Vibrio coralliirubri TaxID=1516159 RepID=A0AA86XKF6_9VIBR|nr:hypothetical protein VCR31J2_1270751 [Vibrio coralliirubri]
MFIPNHLWTHNMFVKRYTRIHNVRITHTLVLKGSYGHIGATLLF